MKQLLKIIILLLLSGFVWFCIQTILLITTNMTDWTNSLISLVCAIWVGLTVWKLFSGKQIGTYTAIPVGALIFGALGFIFSFFGPVLLNPNSHQTVFTEIMIATPLSMLLGAVGGYFYARKQKEV